MKTALITILVAIFLFFLYSLGSLPETEAIWEIQLANRGFNKPVEHDGRFYITSGDRAAREYYIKELDGQGKILSRSIPMPFEPYQPVAFDEVLVVAERGLVIRGFSIPGLELLWETGSMEPIRIPPINIGRNSFTAQSTKNTLFRINAATGESMWTAFFSDSIINYDFSNLIVCLHGYKELSRPAWKLSGVHSGHGDILWTYDGRVNPDRPLVKGGIVVTTTEDGQLIVLNEDDGQKLYKHPSRQLTAQALLDEHVILIDSEKNEALCLSLNTGDAWIIPLQGAYITAVGYKNVIIIVDKVSVRAINSSDGSVVWERRLEDVYNAFAFRSGIFVTYKDSFFDVQTYGVYIDALTGENIWVAYDTSSFREPLATSQGDLLITMSGRVRMMPSTSSSESADQETTQKYEQNRIWNQQENRQDNKESD